MHALGSILFSILKFVLTDKVCKGIAADQIEKLIKSTENTVDDKIAEPILKYLRK